MSEENRAAVSEYIPKEYWESRLSEKYSLAGVGDIRMPLSYNKVLYALRGKAFDRAIRAVGRGSVRRILDIGSGSGFYIEKWRKLGCDVTGSDLTQVAVRELTSRYPGSSFIQWDAGSEHLPEVRNIDAVSAFDVFFHIVDDGRYERAISNVSQMIKPGGYFFYSDYFMRTGSKRMQHIAFRSDAYINSVIGAQGMREVTRFPVFYFMNSPMVTNRRLPRLGFRAMLALATHGEIAGALVGWSAYPLERLFLAMGCESTGTELVVYQKVG